MKQPYEPAPGSLAAKVCTFLLANPGEELTNADVATKFPPVQTRAVTACLMTPCEHGLLKRVRSEGGEIVYRAGPQLGAAAKAAASGQRAPAAQAAAVPAPAPAAAPALAPAPLPPSPPPAAAAPVQPVKPQAQRMNSQGRRWVRLPEIDATTLPVRHDLPLPMTKQAVKGVTRYDEVFAGLKEPGQSRAPIDIAYYGSMAKAAKVYMKAHGITLLVRKLNDRECGVWRT